MSQSKRPSIMQRILQQIASSAAATTPTSFLHVVFLALFLGTPGLASRLSLSSSFSACCFVVPLAPTNTPFQNSIRQRHSKKDLIHDSAISQCVLSSSSFLTRANLFMGPDEDNSKGASENDDTAEEKGFFRFLPFSSSKEEPEKSASDLSAEEQNNEGILRFLSRGKGKKDGDESKQLDKEEEDKDSMPSRIVKSIAKRFSSDKQGEENIEQASKGTRDSNKNPPPLTKLPPLASVKTPPPPPPPPPKTSVPSFAGKKSQNPPASASKQAAKKPSKQAIKTPINKKTEVPKQPAQAKVQLPQQSSSGPRNKKKAEVDEENTEEKEGSSLFGRVQRFVFGTNNSTEADEASGREKGSRSSTKANKPINTRSVAQKFLSNIVTDSSKSKEQWVAVCPKTRLSPGEIVPVNAAGLELILVASKDGQNVYCMANSCPHLGTPLETGFLERRPMETTSNFPKDTAAAFFAPPPFPSDLQESDIAALLSNDGCEDCIVCPLHKTAFALQSGEVRGEWCPYPPVLGKMMATVKQSTTAAVFDVRTKGKNIEVRINTPLMTAVRDDESSKTQKKKKNSDTQQQ
jgi:nitrite reductase/ring-hydroxylating ferredoxin subunit